jgi:ABC-2 type transport system permease protein
LPTTAAERSAGARRVVLATTARRATRSAALWGSVFGSLVVASAAGYATTFPTAAERRTLAASFGSNAGIAALIGPARHLDNVAGFTAWRCVGIVGILGGVWTLLLATRLVRGEEEAGRWELLLAGQVTRRGAAMQAAAGLAVGLAVAWVTIAGCAVAVGASKDVRFAVSGSLFLSTALIAGPAMFAAIGLLMSQLATTRRQANALGGAVLGAAYLVRMVGDAGAGLSWLRWLSPLGWIELLYPMTGSRWLPVVPLVALVGTAVVAAATVAGRRDLGAGALASPDAPPPRFGLLGGPGGLSLRLTRSVAIAWTLALFASGAVFGLVAQSASKVVSGSKTITEMLARLGGTQAGAKAYIGFAFIFAASLVAFAAAAQVGALRTEEADGYVDNLLVRPVSRRRWFAGRLGVALGLVSVASVMAGVGAWLGAASQHSGIGFAELLAAGVNVLPPAVFVLGFGAVLFALRPRWAPPVAYAVVTWSFVVELVASLVTSNRVLLRSSLLHYVTPAPATAPNWQDAAVVAGLGVLGMVIGVLGFERRDLVSA